MIRYAAAAGLLIIAFARLPHVATVAPTVSSVEAAEPVRAIVRGMDAADSKRFRSIYGSAAKIVAEDGRDVPSLADTSDLRTYHVTVLKWLWNGDAGNSLDKYSGLRPAIEKAITDTIGNDQRTLTDTLRGDVVNLFRAIGE